MTGTTNSSGFEQQQELGGSSQLTQEGSGKKSPPSSSSKLFKRTSPLGFSLKQLNLKEAERNSKQNDILEYYRKLEDKDAEISNLTVRLSLREGYADAADQT